MAPTVFRTRNLRVVIYPRDHLPPHVHVIGPDVEAKFEILTLECISSNGFAGSELERIRYYLSERQEQLMEKWNAYQ